MEAAPTPRTSSATLAPIPVAIALVIVTALGCAAGRPTGPAFEPLAPPDPASTLVYIYRDDVTRGVNAARVRLDGDDVVQIRNGEYVAFVIDPGTHELGAALMWLGLLPRSWNHTTIETRGGETIYVKLWADTGEMPTMPADARPPGSGEQKADVALFMAVVDRATAEGNLPGMRRANMR